MPLIRFETNARIDDDTDRRALCTGLSRIVAAATGKPEAYVQAIVADCDSTVMLHGGAEGPAAFVDVRSIGGLTAAQVG